MKIAVVATARRLSIPTPYNETMVWLIRSLEETFTRIDGGGLRDE